MMPNCEACGDPLVEIDTGHGRQLQCTNPACNGPLAVQTPGRLDALAIRAAMGAYTLLAIFAGLAVAWLGIKADGPPLAFVLALALAWALLFGYWLKIIRPWLERLLTPARRRSGP